MASEGFLERYRRFFQQRAEGSGFEFHNPPPKSVPPPIVLFSDKLRWWSWNRWQRRKKIRAERDRRLQDIFAVKQRNPPAAAVPTTTPPREPQR